MGPGINVDVITPNYLYPNARLIQDSNQNTRAQISGWGMTETNTLPGTLKYGTVGFLGGRQTINDPTTDQVVPIDERLLVAYNM